MDDGHGFSKQLPPLADYPPASVQAKLPPEEWQACLDAWIFAVEFRLRLLPDQFSSFRISDPISGSPFLLSYTKAWSLSPKRAYGNGSKESRLHRQCLLLLRRLMLELNLDPESHKDLFPLLSEGSITFASASIWKETLGAVWRKSQHQIAATIGKAKKDMMTESGIAGLSLKASSFLVKALPDTGVLFMTGSDYLDWLVCNYAYLRDQHDIAAPSELKLQLTEHIFVCLRSLMTTVPARGSLLIDHLYSLQSAADRKPRGQPTLLSSLLSLTTFLRRLDVFLATNEQKRGSKLLELLHSYREQTFHLHALDNMQRPKKHKSKGKERALPNGDMHIHQASQVSEIHELFPDLSSAYIMRLLDRFSDNVETVIAALLEPETLPPDLRDRGPPDANSDGLWKDEMRNKAPHTTLPTRRKNFFDEDDFDNLRIEPSKVHIGRKEQIIEMEADPDSHSKRKAAIMAALAAFDSDDDERDDTYDVADVGGTVDDTVDTDSRTQGTKAPNTLSSANDEVLFGAWRSSPEIFARDSKTRLSQPRQQLKRETGMADEQIEGWAVILGRDPGMLKKLENRLSSASTSRGQQNLVASTKWQANRSGTASEDEDSEADQAGSSTDAASGGRGRGYTVGRSRGFGRGGGTTAGPSDSPATQNARRRKEQGRGRGGASHNRREGRAKKMGRGMAGMPA
jgi:activating signal cointegrator complex subunit 2